MQEIIKKIDPTNKIVPTIVLIFFLLIRLCFLAFDLEADYRDLLTTRETFINPRLAAIYNIRELRHLGSSVVECRFDTLQNPA